VYRDLDETGLARRLQAPVAATAARAESLWGSWKNRFCGDPTSLAPPTTSRAAPGRIHGAFEYDSLSMTSVMTWNEPSHAPFNPGLRRACVFGLSLAGIGIPMGAWMSVSWQCCVLSGRGLCVGLFTRPQESYRMWYVWMSAIVKPRKWGGSGPRLVHHGKKKPPLDLLGFI
jgi:hypothetical protein